MASSNIQDSPAREMTAPQVQQQVHIPQPPQGSWNAQQQQQQQSETGDHVSMLNAYDQWEEQDPSAYFRSLRKKVMWVSMASGICVIIGGILNYAFKVETDLKVIHMLQRLGVVDEKAPGLPNGFVMAFFTGLPAMLFGTLLTMCVPTCGYYGAKLLNPNLLSAFCCCSTVGAIGGVLTTVLMIWVMAAAIPMADHWVETCDPSTVCCGPGYKFCDAKSGVPLPAHKDRFMDCILAAHPKYQPKIPGNNYLEREECKGSLRIVTKCDHYGYTDADLDTELAEFRRRYPKKTDFWKKKDGRHLMEDGRESDAHLMELFSMAKKADPAGFEQLGFKEGERQLSPSFDLARAAKKLEGHVPEAKDAAMHTMHIDKPIHIGPIEHAMPHHPPHGGPKGFRFPLLPKDARNKHPKDALKELGGLPHGHLPHGGPKDVMGHLSPHGHHGGPHHLGPHGGAPGFEKWLAEKGDHMPHGPHGHPPHPDKGMMPMFDFGELMKNAQQAAEKAGGEQDVKDAAVLAKEAAHHGPPSTTELNPFIAKLPAPKAENFEKAGKYLSKPENMEKVRKEITKADIDAASGLITDSEAWKDFEKFRRRRRDHHRHRGDDDDDINFDTCVLNEKAVHIMKLVHDNLPDVTNELEVIFAIKVLLAIPGVLLALLSSFYGCKLWRKARTGYRPTFFSTAPTMFAPSLQQPMIGGPVSGYATPRGGAPPVVPVGGAAEQYAVAYNPGGYPMVMAPQMGAPQYQYQPAATGTPMMTPTASQQSMYQPRVVGSDSAQPPMSPSSQTTVA